ncbi:MAG: enoyl-CoA hydratase [Desulfobacterium sp.]|nr:enoyl-CoA hydratase [Desulfobacterium sp.]
MLVTTQKKNHVCLITINREKVKNAVDGPTAKALAVAFRDFEEDEASDVAILAGAGNTFCAGADLKAVANAAEGRFNTLAAEGDGPMGPSRMVLSKPVIAAIAGYAVAGGLELALWCDMRIMEETAIMGVFCRRFGVPLIDGGTIRLPRLIGMSRAMDLILTGRPVKADEALSIGLVNRVVGHGQGIAAAEELAATIAGFPQTCMRSDRMSAYEQWSLSLEDALQNEFNRGMKVISSGETLAGADRFAKGIGKHGEFKV